MTPKVLLKSAMMAGLMLTASVPALAQAPAVPAGFTALFDGKTLNGWSGDPSIWSVQDGAITGHSDKDIPYNTYLILDKPFSSPNYEIRFKYRFQSEAGNSGLQFRSGQVAGNHIMAGLQANIVALGGSAPRFAMLYDELDRQELVLTGQKATIERAQASNGGTGRIVRTVHEMVNAGEDIQKVTRPRGEWNEGVLIVYGNRYVHAVNGHLAFDATDEDPLAPKDGLIGWQFHKGPPTTIQFKDIVIQPLAAMPDISRFASKPAPAPAPTRTYRDAIKVGSPDLPMPD